MNDLSTFTLERRFAAPRALVWEAWTFERYMSRWYGPGVETVIHENNPLPGGRWCVEMKSEGQSVFQRADYIQVAVPSRITFLQGMSDADWTIIDNPHFPDWPRLMHTDITFSEPEPGQTDLRLIWSPHEPSAAEAACFAELSEQIGEGWRVGLDILGALLTELQAERGSAQNAGS